MKYLLRAAIGVTAAVAVGTQAEAQSNEDLAKQLSNPIADLVSLPF